MSSMKISSLEAGMTLEGAQTLLETPIVRPINPLTGLREGDDSGYRKVSTLHSSRDTDSLISPPVNVESRLSYDGVDEYGAVRPEIALPGGLEGNVSKVRESVAKFLELAQIYLDLVYDKKYRVALIDGFRSWKRQAAGFTRILKEELKKKNIDTPSVIDLWENGMVADGTFAWVNADQESPAYQRVKNEIAADPLAMEQIKEIAHRKAGPEGQVNEEMLEEAMYDYITISANSEVGFAKGQQVPLNFENNAHAGGGAIDIFLLDQDGKVLNNVPFDFVGEEAGMDYMEHDENFDHFRTSASQNPILREHVRKLGVENPENLPLSRWIELKIANRIRKNLSTALGATYYSAHDPKGGGENWHIEPGNVLYGLDGTVIHAAESAEMQPDSGNPGHTLQKLGRDQLAVWGGRAAHLQLEKQGFLGV